MPRTPIFNQEELIPSNETDTGDHECEMDIEDNEWDDQEDAKTTGSDEAGNEGDCKERKAAGRKNSATRKLSFGEEDEALADDKVDPNAHLTILPICSDACEGQGSLGRKASSDMIALRRRWDLDILRHKFYEL